MKYDFTGETKVINGVTVRQIVLNDDIQLIGLSKGTVGGWIESVENLDVSDDGVCWVYESSYVYGDAKVLDDVQIIDSTVCDSAIVCGDSHISESQITGNTYVEDTHISECKIDGGYYLDSFIYDTEMHNSPEVTHSYVVKSHIDDATIVNMSVNESTIRNGFYQTGTLISHANIESCNDILVIGSKYTFTLYKTKSDSIYKGRWVVGTGVDVSMVSSIFDFNNLESVQAFKYLTGGDTIEEREETYKLLRLLYETKNVELPKYLESFDVLEDVDASEAFKGFIDIAEVENEQNS